MNENDDGRSPENYWPSSGQQQHLLTEEQKSDQAHSGTENSFLQQSPKTQDSATRYRVLVEAAYEAQEKYVDKNEPVQEYPLEDDRNLETCPHCSRTFLSDRLQKHLKMCNAEKPFKKVGEKQDSTPVKAVVSAQKRTQKST